MNEKSEVDRLYPLSENPGRAIIEAMGWDFMNTESRARDVAAFAAEQINQLRSDALTMALRLLGEQEDSFAPETREVMKRWRPIAEAKLKKV